jgi:hypothetical protein
MRPILVVTDVHADVDALQAIFDVVRSGDFCQLTCGRMPDVINLGDVLQRGYKPTETVDLLSNLDGGKITSVLGNHDDAFLFDRPVSGSDAHSEQAHKIFKYTYDYWSFFRDVQTRYLDRDLNLLAVHGGPMDTEKMFFDPNLPDSNRIKLISEDDRLLYDNTWQRISTMGRNQFEFSGFHYRPELAFDNKFSLARDLKPGYLILCGHEHFEAAYREKDGVVQNILNAAEPVFYDIDGRRVEVKSYDLTGANHMFRIGISGPAGYHQNNWHMVHFGLLLREDNKYENRMLLCKFEFPRNLRQILK